MDENITSSNIINSFWDNISNNNGVYCKIYFCKKNKSEYTAYQPSVSEKIKNTIVELVKEYLQGKANLVPVHYSPTRACTDLEIENCYSEYVGNYKALDAAFSKTDHVDTNIKPSELAFYCLEFGDLDDTFKYRLYRRITKFRRLSSKGILAYFRGGTLDKIDDEMFGIDGSIDILQVEEQFWIFNHIALERIFDLKDKFIFQAKAAMDILREANCIENFDAFEEDCLSDHRYHKTLAKIMDSNENFGESLVNNFDGIREAIDTFDLPIEITETLPPKIVYENKSQRMDILRIIDDAYCKSIIGNRQVINRD